MRVFLDTNVLISALTDEDGRGEVAKTLLEKNHEFYTDLIVLMEVRTFFIKEEEKEASDVDDIISEIKDWVNITALTQDYMLEANEKHKDKYLDPLDCLIYTSAKQNGTTLATFDSELRHHGACEPGNLV